MLHGLGDSHGKSARAKTIAEGILRDAAAAEKNHLVLLAVNADDGALNSHVAHTTDEMAMQLAHFSAVQDLNWPVVEIAVHVLRSRRRDVSELVGGRGCNRESGLGVKERENSNDTEQLADNLVLGTAEPHLSRARRH